MRKTAGDIICMSNMELISTREQATARCQDPRLPVQWRMEAFCEAKLVELEQGLRMGVSLADLGLDEQPEEVE